MLLSALATPAAETVRSPDQRIEVAVDVENGRPCWSVSVAGTTILDRGALGLELATDSFRPPFEIIGVVSNAHDKVWHPVWGNWSAIRDRHHERIVTFSETTGARRRFEVQVRVSDEGVGLRYAVPKQDGLDRVTIKRRLTEYPFGADRPIYQNRNYEYGTKTIATMAKSEGVVTVALDGGRFAALTDADRADFSQVSWERSKERPGTIVGTLHSAAEGATPFRTSWDALIIGDTAHELYEKRHVVENLCPPCSVADTSWIRPGAAICQVRNTRIVTDELKKLCDFASAHGIEYLEIDHSWCGAETKWTAEEIAFFATNHTKFWDDKPEWRNNVGGNLRAAAKGWVPFRPKADSGGNFVDLDVPALCAYGKSLNPPVGICLYVRGVTLKEFGGEHAIEDVFSTYEKWGVAGVKPGFVPPGSQQNERAIAYMVGKAAEHKLIVCIHDAYYPAGLSRTYPNLVNVEGVAGEEAEHSIPAELKSRHDVMLPYTRCLMGPVDYTPEIFNKGKTHAHQVAMLGVYHGRTSIRGGLKQWSPGGEGGPEIAFVEKLPGLFDEMKVSGELGRWVTVARRAGTTWYVSTLGGPDAVKTSLPLSFLADGTYTATIFADTPGHRTTTRSAQRVTAATTLPLELEPNGGHLLILEKFQ